MDTTFRSLCYVFMSSTCHNILHWYPSTFLFVMHQSYQFILKPPLFRQVISFTQTSSAASRIIYKDFRHSSYTIFKPFSYAAAYFWHRYLFMWSRISAISPYSFKCVLSLVSYVCKKYTGMSDVATSLYSPISIIYENIGA